MSRKVSSSAPSASYTRAISTGSPASRRPVKLTPLTTRPASTSRHGMTRTARLMRTSLPGGAEQDLSPSRLSLRNDPLQRSTLGRSGGEARPSADGGQRLRQRERAGVERLAHDGAL